MSAREPVVVVKGLRTAFGPHVIHENLDFVLPEGRIVGLVGGSGTGKSVLLNTIIGLRDPQAGTVDVLGLPVHRLNRRDGMALRRKWGVLFQYGALFSNLSVRENIKAPMREHSNLPETLMDELADLKISLVGLPPEAGGKKPSELSGGMRKRAGLARALAMDPEILFLDEPTAGLDPIGAGAFDALLRRLTDTLGLTVLLVTHDLDTLHTICDEVGVLAEKRIIAMDTISGLLNNPHPWIQEYFAGPRGRAAQRAAEAH